GAEIGSCYTIPSNQYLAVFGQLYFAIREDLADRTAPQMKWVIHANERRSFGKAVTLDHGKTEPAPELLRLLIQRRATRDECPEFPTELAVNVAERPPAGEEVLPFGRLEAALKIDGVAGALEIAHDLCTQRLQHPGNRD